MMDGPTDAGRAALNEIVQAVKAKPAFEVLYPEGSRRKEAIEFVARLTGRLPDAYDVLAAGAYLETLRVVRERCRAAVLGDTSGREASFDWEKVSRHDILHALEDLTVSMGSGKGRREGVEIAKTSPVADRGGRWLWRREG